MGLLPEKGKRIYFQPFEMTQLARDGDWNQEPFLEDIAKEKFPLIMIWSPPFAREIKQDRWTPRMLEEIRDHYERKGRVADMVIYRPKSRGYVKESGIVGVRAVREPPSPLTGPVFRP